MNCSLCLFQMCFILNVFDAFCFHDNCPRYFQLNSAVISVHEALSVGFNPVIVDNTNIHIWEMLPYVELV